MKFFQVLIKLFCFSSLTLCFESPKNADLSFEIAVSDVMYELFGKTRLKFDTLHYGEKTDIFNEFGRKHGNQLQSRLSSTLILGITLSFNLKPSSSIIWLFCQIFLKNWS